MAGRDQLSTPFWRQSPRKKKKNLSSLPPSLSPSPSPPPAAGGEKKAAGRRAMQIRVRCGCGEAGCPEWAIVEVQGVVQPQPCFSGRIQGLHIGRLCAAAAPSSKARTHLRRRRSSTPLPPGPGHLTFRLIRMCRRRSPSPWGTMSSPAPRWRSRSLSSC